MIKKTQRKMIVIQKLKAIAIMNTKMKKDTGIIYLKFMPLLMKSILILIMSQKIYIPQVNIKMQILQHNF